MIARALRGREGLGEFHRGGEWHRGRHDALIDEATWLTAQALDERGRTYAPGAAGRLPKRHLFVRGMLRCDCGEAMLPRSARDQADVYVCRRHKMDSAACAVQPLKRSVIDRPALYIFEEVALDVEQTRAHVTTQLNAQMAETRALAAQAAHEVAELAAQEERLDRDYRGGVLPPERYSRVASAVADERAAADANARRLTDRVAEVEAAITNVDAESETLTRLAELRAAVAERVMDAPGTDIGALRAALAAACSEVRLRTVEDGMVALDYIPHDDAWRRVGLAFAVEPTTTGANYVSGSGVPL